MSVFVLEVIFFFYFSQIKLSERFAERKWVNVDYLWPIIKSSREVFKLKYSTKGGGGEGGVDFVYLIQKNFSNMCVKTDVDIVDNIRNIPHLQKKISPKKIRLYVCQKQRRHCRQIQHQNISKW